MKEIIYSGDHPEIGEEEVKAVGDPTRYAYVKKIVVDGKKIFENKEKFGLRKAHLRPFSQPTSLDPKLARAMINISGAKEKVCDPFCGTGGILIEAGLMGFEVVGYDNVEKMVKGSKRNLKHFGIKEFDIEVGDATKEKLEGTIVTDLPYSKNTKKVNIERLLKEFLQNIKKNKIKGRIVLGLFDAYDYKKIIKKQGFRILKEFEHYLHKSLSKRIVVVE